MPRSAVQIADHAARLDHFAELVSLDLPISIIALRMGVHTTAAHAIMAQLREKYGWQSA